MIRRSRSQPKPQPRVHATPVHELPKGQLRLIHSGLEALRDPEMERRVHAHLESRGDSPRDLIGAALVAARFQREQQGVESMAQEARRGLGISPA